MRHLFILNPIAGGKRNNRSETLNKIERYMLDSGEDYDIYITTGIMDAAEKVKREALKGTELRVYACGGDGTLNECVHGAAGFRNAAVTHFPCGTGNDFIKTFGDEKELFFDLANLVNGKVVPFDIIDVNGRKSINISSVGLDARIGTGVHKYSKLPLIRGKGAYIVSTIMNVLKGINNKFSIKIEDEEFSGKFALVCVCNGRYYGGGFNPTKTAMPNDGIMDILVVNQVNIFTLVTAIGKYAAGEYYKVPKLVKHFSGRKITIASDEEIVVNIDGEAIYTKEVTMKLVPQGVNFIMPANSKFFELENELYQIK